jgi:hypothetical protein
MAGSLSDYAEKKVQDLILGAVAFTAPATHVALFTVAPTDSGGGTEVTGGSYARVNVTNNATNWPAATGATAAKSNGTAITFPTASASWGTVVAFGIFDAGTGGNLLWWGDLTTSKAVGSGDTPSFAIGALAFTMD